MGERTKAERERKRLKLVYGIRSTMAKKDDGDATTRRAATTIVERICDPIESIDIACKRYGLRYSCQNSILTVPKREEGRLAMRITDLSAVSVSF